MGKLISICDCKKFNNHIAIGSIYKIIGQLGNGYVIDIGVDAIVVLKSRIEIC